MKTLIIPDEKVFNEEVMRAELNESFALLFSVDQKTIDKIIRIIKLANAMMNSFNPINERETMRKSVGKIYNGLTKREVFKIAICFQRYIHLNYVYDAMKVIEWEMS